MRQIFTFTLLLICSCIKAQTTETIAKIEGASKLLVIGDDLYIAEASIKNTENKIFKIDLTSSTATPIEVVTGLKAPRGLAYKGNYLYISEANGDKISKIDITSATPSLTDVITGLDSPRGLAFKGNDLYFSEYGSGKVSKIDITSTTPTSTEITKGLDGPGGITFKGNDLYITQLVGASTVVKVDITDVSPTTTNVTTALKSPAEVIFKGNNLYISEYLGSKISKLDITTGSTIPTDAITELSFPSGIVVYGNDLYITEIVFFNPDRIVKTSLSTTLSTLEVDFKKSQFKLYPNPTTDFITISGLETSENYEIYNSVGSSVKKGRVLNQQKIDLQNLSKGFYVIKFENNSIKKFLKN